MPLLRVEKLSKSFGGLQALKGVSFIVAREQIKAIIGPNGAGKTTLFNVLTGVLKPTSGEAFFRDRKITGLKTHQIVRLGIARTFQTPLLFEELTVLENVMLAAGFPLGSSRLPFFSFSADSEGNLREESLEILGFVKLKPKADLLAGLLSAGERRLLEIARALALKPVLIMLDEPAAGLNPAERENLKELIKEIRNQGLTVLLVEHDMGLVMEVSDEVLVLDEGEKIAEGPPLLIQEDDLVVEAYLGGELDA